MREQGGARSAAGGQYRLLGWSGGVDERRRLTEQFTMPLDTVHAARVILLPRPARGVEPCPSANHLLEGLSAAAPSAGSLRWLPQSEETLGARKYAILAPWSFSFSIRRTGFLVEYSNSTVSTTPPRAFRIPEM